MKFQDMPYERLDMEKVRKEFAELTANLEKAQSGEEAFAVHERYYKLTDHCYTEYVLSMIRHDIDMTDEYYAGEQAFYDEHLPEIKNL
ncbi:MAG: M3 family oligoendopeptidase, partial [Lachnospiraceae bacterium]|nr:M3 family oligoendopeptidase [Lachnospiraceae bacterium]